MVNQVEALYKEARKNYKNLDVKITDLTTTYWFMLKWLLEVTLGSPKFDFKVIFEPVVGAKLHNRYFLEVTYRMTKDDYLIKIFNNNEIAFYPHADLELARRITYAFNKWCELVFERVFRGSRI